MSVPDERIENPTEVRPLEAQTLNTYQSTANIRKICACENIKRKKNSGKLMS